MYKLVMILVIFLCSTIIGFSYGERFSKRLDDLKEAYRAIILLQNEILYNNTPLSEAFNIISTKLREPFSRILKKFSKELDNLDTNDFSMILKDIYSKNEDELYFDKSDKKIIEQFSISLGNTGIYGQENIFKLVLENLKINISEAEELAKKNAKLYRYLGMCFGAMISIVLI